MCLNNLDDNACFVCYDFVRLSISPTPFYSFFIIFLIRPLPPVTPSYEFEKTFGTFKTRDGLRPRAPLGFLAEGNIPGYRQSPTRLCYVGIAG
jgi:hypothetical protein